MSHAQFKSKTFKAVNGASVEVGTMTFQGKDFAAYGSIIDEQSGVIVGYPKDGRLTTWNGQVIEGLKLTITSSWSTPHSWQASRRYAYRATYKGKCYHGSGFGDGMILRLHASKAKKSN